MKKILIITLSFLSISVAFAKTDYLSSQGYASNKAFVEEIVAMEGAVAFVGRSSAKPSPHASYAVLIKDENAQYTQLCFGSKELDDDKNFINFTLHKNRIPKEGENPNYEYPVDEANANIYLKVLEEQITLAEEKGDNEGVDDASLYVNEMGVKLGDKWVFAGKREELNRYSIARKLCDLASSPSQKWLNKSINALAYDYRALAKDSLKNTLINFDVERGRQYFGIVDFDKDETKATFVVSTKANPCHFKVMTLKNICTLKLSPDEIFRGKNGSIKASTKRDYRERGTSTAGAHFEFDSEKDYSYLYESDHIMGSKIDTEFLSVLQLRADESWQKSSPKMKRGEEVIYRHAKLEKGTKLSRFFKPSEEEKLVELIDKKINPPLIRFKGQTNKEFAEAFGVATFKDEELVGFWSVHINAGHTSLLSFEDDNTDEKNVFDLSLDFDQDKRRYSSLIFSLKDKSGTVSYINFVDGEKVDTLRDGFRAKTLREDIEIIRAYKDNTKGLTRVIFSAKIVQE